jgi:hypothetical protein
MTEMKYLRDGVDMLPTPIQGVAAIVSRLPMRFRNLVPNLFLLRKRWKLLNKQHYLTPRSLSLLNLWRLAPLRQTYRFPRWCVLSYCEIALYGISESLQHSNIELPEETTQLCSSIHVGLRHAIALSCKARANSVLKRRDHVIAEAESVIRLPQLTGALRSAPLGESFLFQDFLEEAIKIQKTLDPIPTSRASWPDKAKKQTTSQVQSTYSVRDYQGGSSMAKT